MSSSSLSSSSCGPNSLIEGIFLVDCSMENTRSPKHQLEPADQSLDVHKRRQMDVLTFHPQPRDDQSQISPPINNAYLGETSQVLEVEAPGINSDGDLDWLTASWLPDAINDPSPADDAVCYGMVCRV